MAPIGQHGQPLHFAGYEMTTPLPVEFVNPNPIVPGVATIGPSSSLASVVAYLNSLGYNGAGYATWYTAAHLKDSSLTPYQGIVTYLAGTGISNAIGSAVGATGTATGQIATGTVNGLNQFSKDVLGGFNLGGWFLRIGEILLGLVLIGVGVARITGVQNVVSAAVKTKMIP